MKVIREMIRHESDFINHRLTWLAALQGFLIASLGVSLKSGLPNRVTVLLAVVGIVSSLSVLVSMFCADRAIGRLREVWTPPENYRGPGVIGHPGPGKRGLGRWKFVLPWFVLPVLFTLVWTSLLLWPIPIQTQPETTPPASTPASTRQ